MLELRGLTIEEGDTNSDPDFLMQILELNEELAAIESAAEFHAFVAKVDATLQELCKQVERAFNNDNLTLAKDLLAKMKYYANLKEKLKEMGHLYIS